MESETNGIVTRTTRIWLDDDGILRITILPGAEETLEDARNTVAAGKRVLGGTVRPLLVDLRGIQSQTREARVYYASPATHGSLLAMAILTGSPLTRMIANFALGFQKNPDGPTRLFTSEADAIAWLKTFVIEDTRL